MEKSVNISIRTLMHQLMKMYKKRTLMRFRVYCRVLLWSRMFWPKGAGADKNMWLQLLEDEKSNSN